MYILCDFFQETIIIKYFFYISKKKHLAYLLGNPINKHIDIFLSIIAIPLFTATGIFIVRFWTSGIRASLNSPQRKWGMWKGSLSISNGGLFLIDALLTFWA